MAPKEVPLKGGNMTDVARRGDRVLRESGPWTPTVQRLLAHLRASGIAWSPEPLGWTKDGREALAYVKGSVPVYPLPDWVYEDAVLKRAGKWLRKLHEATADYADPEAHWRLPPRRPAEVICHNDFAPYNMVFRHGELVGVIDWDFAGPGPRLWDLAYLAYRLVPLMRPDNPDAPTLHIDLAGRLRLLLNAYGADATIPQLLAVIVERLENLAAVTHGHGVATGKKNLIRDAAQYAEDAAYLGGLFR